MPRVSPALTIILGSGPSCGCGLPSVAAITKKLQEGKRLWREFERRRWYLADTPRSTLDRMATNERLPAALTAYRYIEWQCARLHGSPNYEQAYYVVRQIIDLITQNLDNAALMPIVDDLVNTITDDMFDIDVSEALRELDSLIPDTVTSLLSGPYDATRARSCYRLLLDAVAARSSAILNLNHDNVLDDLLRLDGINFITGFEDRPVGGVHRWNRNLLADAPLNALLSVSLHGTLNQYRFLTDAGIETIGLLASGFDADRTLAPGGERQLPFPDRPLILAGTFNKPLGYLRGINAEMYHAFRTRLNSSNDVLVIGYGFADQAINSLLIDWAEENHFRRLVLVDPRPFVSGRPAALKARERWIARGQLVEIDRVSNAVAWADVEAHLSPV